MLLNLDPLFNIFVNGRISNTILIASAIPNINSAVDSTILAKFNIFVLAPLQAIL